MSAERGWIADPPPPPPRDYIPGEEHKWSIMMGATNLLPEQEREAIRASSAKYVEEIWTEQEQKNAALRTLVPTNVPPLRIADRYAAGRKHA